MTEQEIDEAIFNYLGVHWKKVVMVITEVFIKLCGPIPHAEPDLKLIAKRLEALVREGRLRAQGDVKEWRFSEVRLPQND